jgi:hypothetical protein
MWGNLNKLMHLQYHRIFHRQGTFHSLCRSWTIDWIEADALAKRQEWGYVKTDAA